VCFAQSYDQLTERGLGLVRHYQQIFGLSEDEYQELYSYMEYWQIVRQCCGLQSSCTNVLERNQPHSAAVAQRRAHSLDYPACQTYRLEQVEIALAETTIWQEYQRLLQSNKMKPPGNYDWTGLGYCQATNTMISAGVGFNGNMVSSSAGINCHSPLPPETEKNDDHAADEKKNGDEAASAFDPQIIISEANQLARLNSVAMENTVSLDRRVRRNRRNPFSAANG
jgi:hypothetical protein